MNDETIRERLDVCLREMRGTQNEALHARYAREAGVLIGLLQADAAEALVSAVLGLSPTLLPLATLSAESGEVEFVGEGYTMNEVGVALGRAQGRVDQNVLDVLKIMSAPHHDAHAAKGWESFTPDRIRTIADDPRIDDSSAYDPVGNDPTPHLPVEHFPATDAHPEVDFDEKAGEFEGRTDVLGADAASEPGSPYDEDDLDLTDFEPAKPAPKTPLEQLAKKSASKKKGKK